MCHDVIHFFACFCSSNYTVHYKSQLPLYKEPYVSTADMFRLHLSIFFYGLWTVHLRIILDNDQLDTHLLYFTIHLS